MKRIRDFGINIGEFKTGKLNKITDVEGLKVGHFNLLDNDSNTGITVISPSDDIYFNPMIAGIKVINGFGKTVGLMQIEELGEIESPILLTNTLSVGEVSSGLVNYMVDKMKSKDYNLKSFNPIVAECNDSNHNKIWLNKIKSSDVFKAFDNLCIDFEEGCVGAGRGMTCHNLKGGIGSSSRVFSILDKDYTIGSLVLSNHGRLSDLKIQNREIGKEILEKIKNEKEKYEKESDKGSIIIIMATDMPLSSRQIKRVLNRANVSLARLGSHLGHGSGDVCIGFSTANVQNREKYYREQKLEDSFLKFSYYQDIVLDNIFRAFIECVEESILNSLITSKSAINLNGERTRTLLEFI